MLFSEDTFFLPFDDDPDALFQLTFECSALFNSDKTIVLSQEWFQVEIEANITVAADTFIQKVENINELWSSYKHKKPEEIAIFS